MAMKPVIATPKLSRVSKLDGISSWSLQAYDTCPGSFDNKKVLVKACEGCYAGQGNYYLPTTIAPRKFNEEDWKKKDWEDAMVRLLNDHRYFRWLDSGDLYAVKLARKVLNVMTRTPWVLHWLPTRMHKFKKFLPIFEAMQALPNVMVRYSSDSVDGEFVAGLHGSTIIESAKAAPAGVHVCQAPVHSGKCSGCRVCWSKEVPVVAYIAHGAVMKKVIRIHKEENQCTST
jgi:hypothetical protein